MQGVDPMKSSVKSIVWDSRFTRSNAARLVRPQHGPDAMGGRVIYTAAAMVQLADGREYRALLQRSKFAAETRATDSVQLIRDGRTLPESNLPEVRAAALAAFRSLYRAALDCDMAEDSPAWPGTEPGRTVAELDRANCIAIAKRNAEAARARLVSGESPLLAGRTCRVYFRSPTASGAWDMESLDKAREYLAGYLERVGGHVLAGGAPAGPSALDPFESFIVWVEGTETLADMGWRPNAERPHGSPWLAPEPDPADFGLTPADVAQPATLADTGVDPAELTADERAGIAGVRDIRVVGTIDLTPTWAGMLPAMLAVMADGSGEGRAMIRKELERMAALADERNELSAELARRESADLSGILAAYEMRGDGCQASGAIVLRHLPDNDCTPWAVHFRNDQDSERLGRPVYYFGDYCQSLQSAWQAFASKVARYDPLGTLGAPVAASEVESGK